MLLLGADSGNMLLLAARLAAATANELRLGVGEKLKLEVGATRGGGCWDWSAGGFDLLGELRRVRLIGFRFLRYVSLKILVWRLLLSLLLLRRLATPVARDADVLSIEEVADDTGREFDMQYWNMEEVLRPPELDTDTVSPGAVSRSAGLAGPRLNVLPLRRGGVAPENSSLTNPPPRTLWAVGCVGADAIWPPGDSYAELSHSPYAW